MPLANRTASAPLLEASGLRRAVPSADGPRVLFDRVDLHLRAGDRVHLGGPSGAGKSSLLRALVALDPLDAGSLSLDGVQLDPTDGPRLRAAVRYVAQTPRVQADTVGGYLDEPAGFAQQRAAAPGPDERARLLTALDLPPTIVDQSCADLSGGERKRLALARALLYRPRALLLDEPTAGLDEPRVERVLVELERFIADGGAAVVASHELAPDRIRAVVTWRVDQGGVQVTR